MSGLTQLVNWTSITTTVNMKRLDLGANIEVDEKNGTVTNTSGTDSNFVRTFRISDMKASGLLVTCDNPRYTLEFVAETGTTSLRFYAPSVNGKTAVYGSPICALKSEYEYLTSKIGLVYFDYTTMPLER